MLVSYWNRSRNSVVRSTGNSSCPPWRASTPRFLPSLSQPVTRPVGASELADYASLIRHMSCLEKASMPNIVLLHRVLATKLEKVYRAFIEADAVAKWLPPNGF